MVCSPTPLQRNLLRANIGFFDSPLSPPMEEYLDSLIVKAEKDLARINIGLDGTDVDDASLAAMYAAWLYRKRATGEGKPRMLTEEIHNRQVAAVTKGQGSE